MLDLITADSANQLIDLKRLRLDGGTQPRGGIDDSHVLDLRQALQNGVQLPAVDVVYDGSAYWLWDGFHRYTATVHEKRIHILASIRPGTLADAQWLSYSANKEHGLKRSTTDKERAIKAALRHPKAPGLSDNMIALHLGVSDKTVTKYRKEMESTSEIPKLDMRQGLDGKQRPATQPRSTAVTPVAIDSRRPLSKDETAAVIWRVVKYYVPMHPTTAALEKWSAYQKWLEDHTHVRDYLHALTDGVKLEPGTFNDCLESILAELARNLALITQPKAQPRIMPPAPPYRQIDLTEAILATVERAGADQTPIDISIDPIPNGPPASLAAPTARFTAAMALDGWELRQVVATGQWWAYNAQHKRSTATYANPNDAISAAYDKQFAPAPAAAEPTAPDAKRMLDLVWELLDGCMEYYGETLWYDDETTAHERLAEIEAECGFGVTLAARLEEE